MKRYRSAAFAVFCLWLLANVTSYRAQAPSQRAIQLDDIMAWKSISTTVLSDDGSWFAYRFAPIEGDGDVIVRQTHGDKQYTFSIGEVPTPAGGGGRGFNGGNTNASVAFSSDAKYLAFTIYPTRTEAAQAKRQRRPLQNKVGIVNLVTGDKIEVSRVQRFGFSGESPGWIALHKYGPEPPSASTPATNGTGGGTGTENGAAAREDRPKGSDLLLRELATGQEINVGNVADFAFDNKGHYLAWVIDAQDKAGNGIQYREMATGTIRSIDSDDKAVYSRPSWTEDTDALAVLKGVDDAQYQDKLYSVVGFKNFSARGPDKTVFNPAEAAGFPADMTVSPSRTPSWTKDLNAILFGIHMPKKKDPSQADRSGQAGGNNGSGTNDAANDDKVNLVIWNYKDPRLQSQQIVQENQDKNFSFLAEYRPAEKKFIRLADETVRDVTPAPEQKWAVGRSISEYELMSNLDGRNYADVYAINLETGERKVAVKKSRWTYEASPTGTHFAYYVDGQYWVYNMTTGEATNITKNVPTSFINTEDDHNIDRPPVPFVSWARDGHSVILSDNWDLWQVPINGGTARNLTLNGKKDQIRYRRPAVLDRDERGVDLTKPVYIDAYGEWTKKDGIAIIEPGKSGVNRVMWDEASYGGLTKAEKADVYLYTRQTFKDPADYYVTDASLMNGKKITDQDTQQQPFLWSSGTILVDYVSAKGDKLQGALHLPANYEKGKQYPTIVYFYEKMSQNAFQYARPTANGFNISAYNSNGYAVFDPDITYKVNDPGMSAVWCLVPAVKAAIATGVVDPKHVGIHGHSWGGYQTAFVITQTDLFAAAVAGAPLTDMISMYGIIYKNTGGTNGEIFESSQGRFTSGPWENWDAYTRNSPVAQAAKVKTPLLMLHNDKDGAVDFTQGMEYFNTLRRMQKPVVLLEYPGENHSLAKRANQKDYTVRMKEYFDHFLMGKPMPEWYEDGVPRLKMDDYLKTRLPASKKGGGE
jgi:dienelactone hydrolase